MNTIYLRVVSKYYLFTYYFFKKEKEEIDMIKQYLDQEWKRNIHNKYKKTHNKFYQKTFHIKKVNKCEKFG